MGSIFISLCVLLLVVVVTQPCDAHAITWGGKVVEYKIAFGKLGARYRKLRLERKMVQEDVLAHGFAVRHYQQLESGRPHSLKTFFRVSKMFKIDPRDLIKGIFNVRGSR